ncbi:alpha/beta hydrolase [Nocardia abscessus]|uniref:alpha/beta fold hydrolase n=1 Tax=Nocardia abscessus TaxID=120957 RepID=UPI00189443C0|nr:alpha/beta hydrolase [Nocardia abscessus]MBF6341187.1 alpha/beta hydrolase [Nocardia abscessus]
MPSIPTESPSGTTCTAAGRSASPTLAAPGCTGLRASYVSGLDADLTPDLIDDRADLPNSTVPTLVVVGRHDVICGPRWGRELHELIPDSRLVILEHSGHMGHLEEPERFVTAVREFVFSPKG